MSDRVVAAAIQRYRDAKLAEQEALAARDRLEVEVLAADAQYRQAGQEHHRARLALDEAIMQAVRP